MVLLKSARRLAANEVPDAIRKGNERHAKHYSMFQLLAARSPRDCWSSWCGRVLLRPASEGTGVIAGGAVRAVLEAAGVRNVLTKCLRTNNAHNVVAATIDALQRLVSPEEMAVRRGKAVDDLG